MAAETKKSGPPPVWWAAAVLALGFLVAPPLIRGRAAGQWVDYYDSLESLPRPRRASARRLVEKADIAIRYLAPLPQASAAARRALEIGQRTQGTDGDRETALVIYRGVRDSCARVRSRWFAGPGFAVIEARAAALERSASEEPGAAR